MWFFLVDRLLYERLKVWKTCLPKKNKYGRHVCPKKSMEDRFVCFVFLNMEGCLVHFAIIYIYIYGRQFDLLC